MIKFAFFYPCDFEFYHDQISGPLGLTYLSSYLKKELNINEVSIHIDIDHLISLKPDIVGISSYTETFNQAINGAIKIKKTINVPVIIGGNHITALPQSLHKCFDIGVIGDGEKTLIKLIHLYLQGNLNNKNYLKYIPGIVYHEDEKIKLTGKGEIYHNLDEILKPDRQIMHTFWPLLGKEWYWKQAIYTSRGCPFKCKFCIYSKINEKVRFHSPERVIEEIEEIIINYPEQKNITIHDDLFALNKERLYNIVKLIRINNIYKKVSFTCMGKPDLFDEEMCLLLKDMNVQFMTFGFESGSKKVLTYLKGKSAKINSNKKTIELCDKYNIKVGGYFIIGTPIETIDDLRKNYWFIRKSFPPLSLVGIFTLVPFPGTKIWDYAIEKGFLTENFNNWEAFDYIHFQKDKYIFLNENMTFEDFCDIYKIYNNLIKKNGVFVEIDRKLLDLKVYYFDLYNKTLEIINKYNIRLILEITNISPSFKEYMEDKSKYYKIDIRTPKEKLKEGKYDLIIYNHSLEQMVKPNEIIKNNRLFSDYFISLNYNPSHISLIFNLISNKWNNIDILRIKEFDNIYFLSHERLKNFLNINNFKILDIQKSSIEIFSIKDLENKLLFIFQKYINIDEISDIKTFGYIITYNNLFTRQ